MAHRIVQAIFLLIALFLASTNWHIYIHEKDGWLCMMAAIAATIASLHIWFD